jgi:DNA-binding beta-propeller fold protein YncE
MTIRYGWREGLSRGLVLVFVLVVATAMQASVCVALAAEPPPLISQFGTCFESECAPAGLTQAPLGVAVNPTTGDVYVVEEANGRVSEFSPWGVFIRAWGWGVRDGSAELQTCTSETGCREGLKGSGAGEFDFSVLGVALDSAGDVFVVEKNNHRVQKFDSEGHFLLMFGGGVDQGPHHPGDVCTAAFIAEGDTCGAGSAGTAAGQFGGAAEGGYIAVGPGDKVYVGDRERIQRFDTSGDYVESLSLPGKTVMALAVAPSGDLYVAFANENLENSLPVPDVVELSPAGATLATLPVQEPWALATDQTGDLYVVDGAALASNNLEEQPEVRKFTSAGVEAPNFTFHDGFVNSRGIATSSACGIEGVDLLISNNRYPYSPVGFFVRLYGLPPNVAICPPPKVAPAISLQYAVSVSDESAAVRAEINSKFWSDTDYYVEYGTGRCAEGDCDQEQPMAPGSQLSTTTNSQVLRTKNVVLQNLRPGTVYHYRFVASSSGGGPVRGVGGEVGKDGAEGTFTTFPSPVSAKADCPNQSLRTGPSALLPDCRVYELVSPIEKNGGDIEVLGGFAPAPFVGEYPARIDQAVPDGERITYSTARAFGDSHSAPWSSQYVAERSTSSGWSSRSLNPSFSNVSIYPQRDQEIPFTAFSEDLCSAWLQQQSTLTLTPNAPEGVPNVYRHSNCGAGGYELLTTAPPPGVQPGKEYLLPGGAEYLPKVQGWTPSGDHSFVRVNGRLTADAASGYEYQLYETSKDGELRLVSVLPNGTATSTGSSLGTLASFEGNDFRNDSVTHAVAANGTRIFWSGENRHIGTTNENTIIENTIYLRVDPLAEQSADGKCDERERACTLRISNPGSRFWAANPAGSRLVYQTGEDLYEGLIEETGETLSVQARVIAAGVNGVLGMSEDLKRVYLVSSAVLSPGAKNEQGAEAVSGKPNLYLYEAGESSRLTFIATVSELDASERSISLDNFLSSLRLARVSANGDEAVFASDADLAGYDNADVNSGEPDYEVYLYEADGGLGRLRCVSCNPTGARPDGSDLGKVGSQPYWVAAEIPGWSYAQYPSRVLSANGSVLFFESYDALLLGDTNGVRDVYEWERASSQQACEELGASLYVASAGGCLSLVSSGESPQPSEFIDASSDGHDVFFTTNQGLVSEDPGLVDLYDARIDGGFPAKPPMSVCEGEACQNPPSPPRDVTPASATFDGPGDLVSTLAAPVSKTVGSKSKPASRAQALAQALRACAKKTKTKRKSCQAAVRRRYGAKHASRARRLRGGGKGR